MVASGSYYLVEKPFLALKKGRVKAIEKREEPTPLITPAELSAGETPSPVTI
jgi:hypothetical protein